MSTRTLFLFLLILCAAFTSLYVSAQPRASFNAGVFNTPSNQPYLETYLTVSAASLQPVRQGIGYKNSVQVSVKILKDSVLVKTNKYTLNGPVFSDLKSPPAFIDNQRY